MYHEFWQIYRNYIIIIVLLTDNYTFSRFINRNILINKN